MKRVEQAKSERIVSRIHHEKVALVEIFQEHLTVNLPSHTFCPKSLREPFETAYASLIAFSINPKFNILAFFDERGNCARYHIVSLDATIATGHSHYKMRSIGFTLLLGETFYPKRDVMNAAAQFRLKV